MLDINRGKLEALQTVLDQGSTLTRTAITAITREVLASEAGEAADKPDLPARRSLGEGGSDKSDLSDPVTREAVSRYGRELAATDSAGIRDLVVMTKEHFGLTLCELAAVMGLAHSTLSKYLNHGRCRAAVLAAAAELWGDPSGRNVGSGVTAEEP